MRILRSRADVVESTVSLRHNRIQKYPGLLDDGFPHMIVKVTQALAEILKEVDQLSSSEKAELADHLAEQLGGEIPPDVERSHLDIVQRRLAEVESGAVELIPGDIALAQVRQAISHSTK